MEAEESRAEEAYRKLEERIVTLDLKPGTSITESRLADALDMGRTPVREAVQRLALEGLLVIRPRLGIVVSDINPADFARLLDARHALEVLLAGASARLAGRDERDALTSCAEAMKHAAAGGDARAFMRRDKEFDEIVAIAACNPYAARAAAPLQTHSRRFWFRYFAESDLNSAALHHMDLMAAIASGKPEAASEKADELMRYLCRQAASLIAAA
ncbi:GntR family transcriptional regulator [Rhizobiales bacterium]|uniref:GntR family transcriptional regulator n=1 Tax=Hongsoonwoonella zoysiae TaxID=2821844 RepID=UPI0015612EED|nr:GntR family transcriptional regulator [Hongsoonwoonella zoysiae]NRG17432.1 GntR family transcriptional regulator [Hongsoonwoonella zoysiae]